MDVKVKKIGNVIMMSLLLMGIVYLTGTKIMAYNSSYDFSFSYEGDWDTTHLERAKGYSYDDAYINCTWAEFDGSSFQTWLYAYNEYDGDYVASGDYVLGQNSEAWVDNGVPEGDTVWFRARLLDASGNDGANFSGRWRPDSSDY